MSDLFLSVLNLGFTASWIIFAVLLLRVLLKKAPKWITCILWAFVAIRLLCPFAINSVLSLIPSNEPIKHDIVIDQTPSIDFGVSVIDNMINPIIADYFTPDPLGTVYPMQMLVSAFSVLWIIGMLVLTIYAVKSSLDLRKTIRASIVLKDNVWVCDEIKSPFILGVWKPAVYVPSYMEEESLHYVVQHEMAHIKRGDHLWKPLGYLLLIVYWFQPLCWVSYVLLCRDIELACDERVVRNMDHAGKAAYSQALLNCSIPGKRIAACPLAFGEVGVKERVKNVLNYKKPACWIVVTAIALCIAVGVCFMTNPNSPDPIPSPSDETQPYDDLIHTYKVAFANWTDDSRLFAKALNHDKLYFSAVRHLPIYKFDTKEALDSFKTLFDEVLTMDQKFDEMPSFADMTSSYTEDFFDQHSLILTYVTAGSSSYRFGVSEVYCDSQAFCMYLTQLNDPENHDDMMAGWFVVVEAEKKEIENCTSFDAQLGTPRQ